MVSIQRCRYVFAIGDQGDAIYEHKDIKKYKCSLKKLQYDCITCVKYTLIKSFINIKTIKEL